MAKGDQAKKNIIAKISEIFGEDYLGEINKKHYIRAKENGETLHIAIALTCSKTLVAAEGIPVAHDWSDSTPASVEITPEETKSLEDMMSRLGL